MDAIRVDKPRPTVHARNPFHSSTPIYDSWAADDTTTLGYFHQEKLSAADTVSIVHSSANCAKSDCATLDVRRATLKYRSEQTDQSSIQIRFIAYFSRVI